VEKSNMKENTRSAAPLLVLTIAALCALTWQATSFGKADVRIDRIVGAGSPPVLRYDHEYVVEGVVDDGGNPYRAIGSISLQIETRSRGGTLILGSLREIDIDRARKRFTARLSIFPSLDEKTGLLRLGFVDRSGQGYGMFGSDWPGSAIPVRFK
jgi:hypothetical protein